MRLENDLGLEEDEIEQLYKEVVHHSRIVRLHSISIKQILAKTKISVTYQEHITDRGVICTAGLLLRPSILSKAICWIPDGMPFNIPDPPAVEVQTILLNEYTEHKVTQVPYGLGAADCLWYERNDKTASIEVRLAKVAKYRLLAEAGNAYGQNLLGVCYEFGWGGITQDLNRSAELYRLSAEQGNSYGQCNYGHFYRDGKCVPEDSKRAVELYTLSAEQGNAWGQFSLGVCYLDGQGVTEDKKRGVELCRLSAEQGNAWGQDILGRCYYNGDGVPMDKDRAVELFTSAAEQGLAFAQYDLGNCYDDGSGVEKDKKRAIELYMLAAEQGNTKAESCLGACYEFGDGIAMDLDLAKHFYTRAAAQGDHDAIEGLKHLS